MSSQTSSGRKRPAPLKMEILEDRTAPAVHAVGIAPLFSIRYPPAAMVAADFNGDGVQDRAIAHKSSREVSVLLGRSDGTFQEQFRFFTGGTGPDALFVDDLSNSGNLDLAVISLETNQILVLYGNGDGTFQPLQLAAAEEIASAKPRTLPQSALLDSRAGNIGSTLVGMSTVTLSEILSSGGASPSSGFDLMSEDGSVASPLFGGMSDSAWLLSSLEVGARLSSMAAERPALTGVLVVNGPGFTTEADIPAPWGSFERQGQETSGAPLCESAAGVSAVPAARELPVDESALRSLNSALEDAFRADRLDGLPARLAQQASYESTLEQVFRDGPHRDIASYLQTGISAVEVLTDALRGVCKAVRSFGMPDPPLLPKECETRKEIPQATATPTEATLTVALTIGFGSWLVRPAERSRERRPLQNLPGP